MTIELTNEEKIQIIDQHIRNLMLNKYNLELSKIENLAIKTVEEVAGMTFDERISEINSQVSALTEQKESLV
jgi:hypothetical protein